MRRAILLLGCAVVLAQARPVSGSDINCMLQFSNGYVTDLYGMYDVASSQKACLELCETYGRESVEGMASSDVVEVLEWTCLYERTPFYRKRIKPVASEGYLVEPEPADSGPDGAGALPQAEQALTEEQIAANRTLVGHMMAAQIAGQAAGMANVEVTSCARLDDTLTASQLESARKELSIMKQGLLPESHPMWDEYFRIGEREEMAKGLDYDPNTCAEALDFLRRQPR